MSVTEVQTTGQMIPSGTGYYLWVDASIVSLSVPEGVICPVVCVSVTDMVH
jgi:hypothetical protein